MKHTEHIKMAILVMVLVITVAAAACDNSEVKNQEFDLTISERKLVQADDVITVKQNDSVTLTIYADELGTVHLHGYDIEIEVGPDMAATMALVVNATGGFPITFHPGAQIEYGHSEDGHEGEEHDEEDGVDVKAHAALFESETLDKGDSFSFRVMEHLDGHTVPYHNHMDHGMEGSIHVSNSGQMANTVEIQGREGSFEPAMIMVRPGTTIVWVNKADGRLRVTSGEPPTGMGEHEHDKDEEEVGLGSLEVRPR